VVAAIVARLQTFLDDNIGRNLRVLVTMAARARDADAAPGLRAILAALVDAGGHHARDPLDEALGQLPAEARDELRRFGVRIGSLDLFHPALLKPAPLQWLTALEAAWTNVPGAVPPPPGIALVAADGEDQAVIAGFRRVGKWWLRVDLAERIAFHTHTLRRNQLEAAVAQKQAAKAAASNAVTDATAVPAPEAEAPAPASVAVAVVADSAPQDNAVAAGASDDKAGDAAMAAAAKDRRSEGAFRIDPELARSIGLPLEDRVAMLRLLGFVPQNMPANLTVEQEPLLWWKWRGRKAGQVRRQHGPSRRRPNPADKGRQPRPDSGQAGGRRDEARREGGRPAGDNHRQRQMGKEKPRFSGSGKDGKAASKPRQTSGQRPQHGRPASKPAPNVHSPFAALAGLFDKKDKQDGDA